MDGGDAGRRRLRRILSDEWPVEPQGVRSELLEQPLLEGGDDQAGGASFRRSGAQADMGRTARRRYGLGCTGRGASLAESGRLVSLRGESIDGSMKTEGEGRPVRGGTPATNSSYWGNRGDSRDK